MRPGLCCCILLIASIAAPAQDSEALRLLQQAVELHQSGKIEAAAKSYEQFLAQFPNHPGARSNLGAVYVALGRPSDAVKQYRAALEFDPRNQDIRFNLALAFYKMGQLKDAIEQLEAVVKDQPANENALVILADCFLRSGENRRVIELLSPLDASGNRSVAYLLGTALIREGEAEKGQLLVERILQDGDSAEARLMLGTAYLMVKEYPSALKEFERAVQLNPRLPSVHAYYGKALNQTGHPEQAVEAFRRELEINRFDFDANLFLGVYYHKEKQDFAEALACLNRALGVRPRADEVRFQIALVYLTQDRVAEAQTLLEDIVRTSPSFTEAHASLATLYYRLRRKEDGDHHRAIVEKLRAERQERIPVPGGKK